MAFHICLYFTVYKEPLHLTHVIRLRLNCTFKTYTSLPALQGLGLGGKGSIFPSREQSLVLRPLALGLFKSYSTKGITWRYRTLTKARCHAENGQPRACNLAFGGSHSPHPCPQENQQDAEARFEPSIIWMALPFPHDLKMCTLPPEPLGIFDCVTFHLLDMFGKG